jgi:hypothetical protein
VVPRFVLHNQNVTEIRQGRYSSTEGIISSGLVALLVSRELSIVSTLGSDRVSSVRTGGPLVSVGSSSGRFSNEKTDAKRFQIIYVVSGFKCSPMTPTSLFT